MKSFGSHTSIHIAAVTSIYKLSPVVSLFCNIPHIYIQCFNLCCNIFGDVVTSVRYCTYIHTCVAEILFSRIYSKNIK